MRVHFPWGSLLDGILDTSLIDPLAELLAPRGTLTVLLSVTPKDRVTGLDTFDERAARAIADGANLRTTACRVATPRDLAASHSTWAKRLGAGRAREAWLLQWARR